MNLFSPLLYGIGLVGALGISARWNWWRKSKQGIPILMYHKVGDPPSGSKLKNLWVSSKKFERQMRFLRDHGYHPIVFRDLYAWRDQGTPLPERPVVITFDDGYQNNISEAFPILEKFGFKATVFVVVQTVGWDNRWHDPKMETRISMMSWADLKTLQKAGWEIGSHTMSHPRLPRLSPEEQKHELQKSRLIIGDFLEEIPQTLAYPYGAGEDDGQIRQIAKEVGYRIAVGIHAGKWNLEQIFNSAYNLPRVFVRGDENLLDFHLQLTRGRARF